MDNLCHTLAGAVLAECGLRKKSPLVVGTMMIGANLPDVDALVYLFGSDVSAVSFRRGWTHGALAMAIWPIVLTFLVIAWDKYVRRRRGTGSKLRLNTGVLFIAALISILSHPLLDLLNNYGVRVLMPFSPQWFYGDSAFIIDLVLTGTFAVGVAFSRALDRKRSPRAARPARIAVAVAAGYIGLLMLVATQTKNAAARLLGIGRDVSPRRLMVAPVPLNPFRRGVLYDDGTAYVRYAAQWLPLRVRLERTDERVEKGLDDPRALQARETDAARRFLTWSRFPYFVSGVDGDSLLVHIGDARYTRGVVESWASVRISLKASR
jgi:inner membrane protein